MYGRDYTTTYAVAVNYDGDVPTESSVPVECLYERLDPVLIDVHDKIVVSEHHSLRVSRGPTAVGKNDQVLFGVPV